MNREEQHNSQLFLRPRFLIECHRNTTDVLATILKNIENSPANYKVRVSDNHIFIDIPEKEAHFWSPQLHFRVDENGNHSEIKGLFGPKSQVWTLFMFIHFVVAAAFIGFAILFYVKLKLGTNVVFPVVMLVALPIIWFVLYFLGQIGKEKGQKQMDALKDYMKYLLEDVH